MNNVSPTPGLPIPTTYDQYLKKMPYCKLLRNFEFRAFDSKLAKDPRQEVWLSRNCFRFTRTLPTVSKKVELRSWRVGIVEGGARDSYWAYAHPPEVLSGTENMSYCKLLQNRQEEAFRIKLAADTGLKVWVPKKCFRYSSELPEGSENVEARSWQAGIEEGVARSKEDARASDRF